MARRLDDLSARGRQLAFGDRPTADQIAGWLLIQDRAPVLRGLHQLSGDELTGVLVRLCPQTVGLPAH